MVYSEYREMWDSLDTLWKSWTFERERERASLREREKLANIHFVVHVKYKLYYTTCIIYVYKTVRVPSCESSDTLLQEV